MRMTQEEKQLKIAEALGWKNCHTPGLKGLIVGKAPEAWASAHRACHYEIEPKGIWHEIPDYFTDLNACHEMESILTDDEYSKYGWTILGDGKIECRDFLGAKAAQRAEAFGLTLGLWEEGE